MKDDPVVDERPLRRAFGRFAWLLGGRATAALLTFAALALTARALGAYDLGMVVLIHTYALLVRGLLNFKLFESIVRYGVPALEDGDATAVRRLIGAAAVLDALSTLGCAVLVVALAPLAGRVLGWDPQGVSLATAYALPLLFSASGTAKGILRLFDRFDTIGRALVVGPVVRLVGVGIAWWNSAGVPGFVWAWAAALAAEHLVLNLLGWRELRRKLPGRVLRLPTLHELEERHPGYWRFLWVVYWQSSLDLLPKQGATLLAGVFLGPAGAGLFRAATAISNVLSKSAVMLRQAAFPDLTRLWHRGDKDFEHLYIGVALWVGIPASLVVLASMAYGESLLAITLGAEYRQAAGLLTILLLAATLELLGASLRPAAYAMGKAGAMLRIQVGASFAYLIVFVAGVHWFGLLGPGLAACALMMVSLVGMAGVMLRHGRVAMASSRDAGGL
ncbi:MAG: hypothetical protein ABFS23_01480 [Pseudomonadota bacterium]